MTLTTEHKDILNCLHSKEKGLKCIFYTLFCWLVIAMILSVVLFVKTFYMKSGDMIPETKIKLTNNWITWLSWFSFFAFIGACVSFVLLQRLYNAIQSKQHKRVDKYLKFIVAIFVTKLGFMTYVYFKTRLVPQYWPTAIISLVVLVAFVCYVHSFAKKIQQAVDLRIEHLYDWGKSNTYE